MWLWNTTQHYISKWLTLNVGKWSRAFQSEIACVLHSFMSTPPKVESFGKVKTQLRKCPHQIALGQARDTFLIHDWWGRTQISVGGTIPGLVVTTSPRNQAEESTSEQASNEHHSSTVLASAPASRFLPWLPSETDCVLWGELTLSSPGYFEWWCLTTAIEKPKLDSIFTVKPSFCVQQMS